MRFQTIEFFSHVNALRQQYQLLFESVIFQLNLRVFEFGNQLIALPLHNFRHMRAHVFHFGTDTFKALFNQRF